MSESGFGLSVGERGKWSGWWNGKYGGMKPERNTRRLRPQTDGSPPRLRHIADYSLVTSARFAKETGVVEGSKATDSP
jgi:hypothetical protein